MTDSNLITQEAIRAADAELSQNWEASTVQIMQQGTNHGRLYVKLQHYQEWFLMTCEESTLGKILPNIHTMHNPYNDFARTNWTELEVTP